MNEFIAPLKIFGVGASLSILVACSGLNLGTANILRDVDVFTDDISEMAFAIDLPLSILPQDDGMVYKLDATTSELGERHINAVLERGMDTLEFSGLTPPANNRTFHLFSFTEEDKIKLREFQAWIKGIKENTDDAGGKLSITMDSNFCRVAGADVSDARVTVFVSLPGQSALNPLFANAKLSEIGGFDAPDLPVCVQT